MSVNQLEVLCAHEVKEKVIFGYMLGLIRNMGISVEKSYWLSADDLNFDVDKFTYDRAKAYLYRKLGVMNKKEVV